MILTITGPSGSGKSSLTRILEKKYGAKKIVTSTTRPPRKHEQQDIDYHFLDEAEFLKQRMLFPTQFNGFRYGLDERDFFAAKNDDFEHPHIIILDRGGARKLCMKDISNIFSVYLQVEPDFAEGNLIHRDGKKAAKARIEEDVTQGLFNPNGYDCILNNGPDMSLEALAYQFMNFVESRIQMRKISTKRRKKK